MNIAKSYLHFLINSKQKHGVHSPFVYELNEQLLRVTDQELGDFAKIKNLKNKYLQSKDIVQIKDLGAGSKLLKTSHRSVKSIAKTACISNKRARILMRLIRFINPIEILELGTSLGVSAAVMSLAAKNAKITTVEACPNTLDIARKMFQLHQFQNIHPILGDFDSVLPKILKQKKFDFIFIDGNHQKEATIRYFEALLTHVHNESCIVFDDIYWSRGMQEAWQYIKDHKKVTVSIDTFRWGVVFFRKEQQKEHFTLRL